MPNQSNLTTVGPAFIYPAEIVFSGVACLAIGIFGVFTNLMIFLVIFKNKKLHTPCFALLAAHAICNLLMTTGYINDGVQRLGVHFQVLGVQYTRLACYLMYVPKTVSIPPSAIFTCMIGLDRLYGIAFPTQYQQNGKKIIFAAAILGGLVAFSLVSAAGLTAPSPITETIMCFNFFAAFHPLFTRYYTNQNLAVCILSVGIYAAIVGIVKCRLINSSGDKENVAAKKNDKFVQSQLAILPMIQTVMIAYLFCGVCPEFMVSIFAVIENGRYQQRMVLYSSILKASSVCTDFFILAAKSREFKTTLKKLLCIKDSTVGVQEPNTKTKTRAFSVAMTPVQN